MAIYKNYILRQGDTVESIAEKFLGSTSKSPEIIALNRLRYPYISDSIDDRLGNARVTLNLSNNLDAGSSSINVYDLVSQGIISKSILLPQSIFYVRSLSANNTVVQDVIAIKKYYPFDSVEPKPDNSGYTFIASGTIVFDTKIVDPPSTSAAAEGMISFASAPVGVSLGSRTYYIRYTYTTSSGETLPSPLQTQINGSAIAVNMPAFSSSSSPRNLLVITAPANWPTNVLAINVYVGSTPQTGSYIGTLTSAVSVINEPSTGFAIGANVLPKTNTATYGISHSYLAGSPFSIYDNPQSLSTQILGTGDIILLPTLVQSRPGLIFNNASSNQFINTLGVDLKIDEKGFLSFDGYGSVDFSTVSGIQNIKQSVKSRLITGINELKSQPNFGNLAMSQIGKKYSATLLLAVKTSIIDTLSREPRINSIQDLSISYDPLIGAIYINNLSLRIAPDGTSASQITFEPIALPI